MIMFFILAALIPFGSAVVFLIELCKPGAFDVKLNIDENLSNYFEALEQSDKNLMILEEENLRKNYVTLNS